MKKIIYTLILNAIVATTLVAQVPVPAKAQESPMLLIGGIAHLGNGQVIQNSVIGFDKGKLTRVEAASENVDTDGYTVVQVDGKHVYPGFILPNSQVGLSEVNAVRSMRDNNETGNLNPNVRSIISYNTDSENIATFRFNGVLLAETAPTGGRISGTSSVVEMEGWNWEDAAHTVDMGMHMNWPNMLNRRFDFSTFTVKTEPNKNYATQTDELDMHFKEAAAYGADNSKVANLKLEAMQGLFDGTQTLFIHAGEAKGIVDAVRFAQS
ncbi:MAG: amidohydrolase, partial [Cyclobacteriaceae bacterium]